MGSLHVSDSNLNTLIHCIHMSNLLCKVFCFYLQLNYGALLIYTIHFVQFANHLNCS